ncbi:MAG: DUF3800 domain-containing protein [Patescibacteria group bacterium]|jgi:hypothetical protein
MDFNVYCDESCHLENDKQLAMSLGAIWCPIEKVRPISQRIREIKKEHGLSGSFEIKWSKVSPAKEAFYLDLVNYFFDNSDLHFRALVIPDKGVLNHEAHNQTHDDWYYKMYYEMLWVILHPENKYDIYLDIKDSRSADKVKKLHDVLATSLGDISRKVVAKIQNMRSHESEILQLADFLLGAVSYTARGLQASQAKLDIIAKIKQRSGYSLKATTLVREDKLNLLRWEARNG